MYKIVLNNAMKEVLELDKNYININNKISKNKESTNTLNKFIDKQEKAKLKYITMQKEQKNTLTSLNKKHKLYKKSLKNIITEQNKIVSILANLTILEKKEKLSLLKNQSKVRYRKYNGDKTIAPLKSYDITKSFGKYKDEVYQKELFNKSVMLKTKIPNAKVYNIFTGEIIFARKNAGSLKNVVIVKHKGEMHTIYAHLDKISPTIKVGKWIQKGYVVGRVNGTLQFQATKNKKYIDPAKLFQ
ncbi:MAG: M23 family metallopeptidase [Campylobacterota bacterium]|nr:M23 family metallopeptidase [Campylobacterota bacterium]